MADPVFERIKKVLDIMTKLTVHLPSSAFLRSMAEITPSLISELDYDLSMDKLDRVEFIMGLEDAFEVSIPDEVSDGWIRLGDVVASIKKIQS